MNFTIGQRVRIVSPGSFNGCQGTIYDIHRAPGLLERLFGERPICWSDDAIKRGVHPKETAYLVDVDGHGRMSIWDFGRWGFPYYWLRPLDDPKADEFIEMVKRWKPEPKAVPVTTEHGTALFPK